MTEKEQAKDLVDKIYKTHKKKVCKATNCYNTVIQYKSTDKYCSRACAEIMDDLHEVKKVSDKRKVDNASYSLLRQAFLLKHPKCFINGCNNEATTIEHRAGRWGKNFLDTKTWAPCCLEHNTELENNYELSKEYQLSKITGKKKMDK